MKWIGQLWRGEITLGKAFWMFGLLIPIVLSIAVKFLSRVLMLFMLYLGFSGPSAPGGLLTGTFIVIVAMAALSLAYQMLAFVGIWRSAERYTGKLIYSVLARGAIALYLAAIVSSVAVALYIWATTAKAPLVGLL
jgi:multisubunit Na+/H+ antiporter MnhB subunit